MIDSCLEHVDCVVAYAGTHCPICDEIDDLKYAIEELEAKIKELENEVNESA